MMCWGSATKCVFHCALSSSFAQFALVMMVGTMVTKRLRGGDIDEDDTEDDDAVNTSYEEIRRKHLPRLSISMRVKNIVCQCTSGVVN